MADKTVNIVDSGHGSDSVGITVQIPIFEMQGNMCTPNQATASNTLSNTAGFYGNLAAISSVTEQAYMGTRSIKVITNTGAAGNGIYLNTQLQVIPGESYTVLVALYGSGTVWTNVEQKNGIGKRVRTTQTPVCTLNDTWQIFRLDVTVGTDCKRITPCFYNAISQTQNIFYVGAVWVGLTANFEGTFDYPSVCGFYDNPTLRITPNKIADYFVSKNMEDPNEATGGDYFDSTVGFSSWANMTIKRDLTTAYGDCKGSIKFTNNTSSVITYPCYTLTGKYINVMEQDNTYWVYAKTDSSNPLRAFTYYYNGSGYTAYKSAYTPYGNAPDWTKFVITSNPTNNLPILRVYAGVQATLNPGESVWVSISQFERGSEATDWEMPDNFDSVSVQNNLNVSDAGSINEILKVVNSFGITDAGLATELILTIYNLAVSDQIKATEFISILNNLQVTDISECLELINILNRFSVDDTGNSLETLNMRVVIWHAYVRAVLANKSPVTGIKLLNNITDFEVKSPLTDITFKTPDTTVKTVEPSTKLDILR